MAATSMIGAAVKRREDPRFITGHGQYTDDIKLPGMVHMAILRSPYAHARIKSIDTSKAKALPGVRAVYTGKDLEGKVGNMPPVFIIPDANFKTPAYPVIAIDTVRYTGDQVAVVVADSPAIARDALDQIDVDYEPLPVVVNEEEAVKPGAPQLHSDVPDNVLFHWKIAGGDPDAAFQNAEVVIKERFIQQRLIPNAMEPRSAVARWDPGTGELTIWHTTQNPHITRFVFSLLNGIPENKIRVISRDVGGGFGSKIDTYPSDVVAIFATRDLGLPVKWVEDRRENFVGTIHGRAQTQEAELAATRDGKITGVRVKSYANMGAYTSTGPAAGVPTWLFGLVVPGAYTIPNAQIEVIGAMTNTTPTSAYRGAGRPEASYLIERMVDRLAGELGMDPVELRRKNLIPADAFPYTSATGLVYDSGNYQAALDKALAMVGYDSFRQEQRQQRQQGKYVGIGFSTYMECCGLAPSRLMDDIGFQAGQWEVGTVRLLATGKAIVLTGTSPHGQGEETTFAQIVSDKLGLPIEDIEVVHGDTGAISMGWGTYGSRGNAVGGSAVYLATEKVLEKSKKLAAHLLEAAPEDIVAENGKFFVAGSPGKSFSIQDIALQANLAWNLPDGMAPGLEENSFFDPLNFVFPFGTHICVAEVDAETGETKILRYIAVDDCGVVINPTIVDGQIHGGIAQGIGQALYEHAIYDENGNLITGSMMDYVVPNARQIPFMELDRTVTPAPQTPHGAKGIGEAGTIASTQAVVNAVVDALAPLGIKNLDMPLTPERVWHAIQQARGGSNGH
ncbi:MAG TPA: xanthine dehydrogenase family protein molybdopterin-binding subunit [Ktedonobacterales bacterium]|nr:xanthine dehydrogenase family protein molybdopterin-binding subunit [Ktedonobacterales bacterium]